MGWRSIRRLRRRNHPGATATATATTQRRDAEAQGNAGDSYRNEPDLFLGIAARDATSDIPSGRYQQSWSSRASPTGCAVLGISATLRWVVQNSALPRSRTGLTELRISRLPTS